MAKKKFNAGGIIYSTDPDFKLNEEEQEQEETLPANQQKIKVQLDKKQRAGKVVTLVYGFTDNDDEVERIGKEIKRFCGTGGSAKNGEIIIQGDFRGKVLQWLKKNGYTLAKII